jgi:3-hydroxy acid dehydrogenase/malonic semialdehyde reductase
MTTRLIDSVLSYKNEEISLKKKTALVTGASSGIGLATAVYLAQEGMNLILVARRERQLLQLQQELKENFPKIRIDVLAIDLVHRSLIVEMTKYKAIDVDVFINNAGLSLSKDFLTDTHEVDIEEMVETNILAAFKLSSVIAKNMVKNGSGHIVHIGSIAGHHPYEGGAVYCATKSALKSFSQAMRQELYDKNVRVSLVSPGIVKTDFSLVRFKGDAEKANQVYEGLECLEAPDIARVIVQILKEPKHVNLDEVIMLPTVQAPVSNKTKRKS